MGKKYLYLGVFLGGFCGGIIRWGFEHIGNQTVLPLFPLGTFFVNILGAFLIGIFLTQIWQKSHWHQQLKSFLTTGLCGGMTTFSSFTYDTVLLLQQQQYQQAMLFMILDVGLSICAAYFGIVVSSHFLKWRIARINK
ncbi:MAG: fluoride efflux transporter CrcB [Culicoidibacterales bacterium]